jgi:RimJ/RimL family protein N-acetyltransferase
MGALLPITTDRLVLRRFTRDDAPAFAAYRSDPEVARYQSWETPYTLASALRLIAALAHLDEPTPGEWLQIATEHAGTLVGDVAVRLSADGSKARVGYTVAPAHQGKGIGTEAVGAVVDALFDRIGIHRVVASLDARNLASQRLLEQLGFAYEGTARSVELVAGEWVDALHYALLRDDWRSWRTRPTARPRDVRLVEITPQNSRAVMSLATHRSQRRFVASVADSYADALAPESENGVPVVPWYRAIEADGELAGFVMLAERTDAHSEAYLWRLLIDRRHQRRGIGDRVLALIVERLRAEGHDTLLVSWHPGRGGPEPFYLARGFEPTGRVVDGEIEARLTF